VRPGDRIAKLILLREHIHGHGSSWSCWCDCGGFVILKGHLLKRGIRKSCGRCVKHGRKPAASVYGSTGGQL
jgi:hypothetical protein